MRREFIPLRRDVVTTETVPVGSLAVALIDAHRKLMDAEAQLDRMLDSLYGAEGWTNFEVGEAFELDVYDCTPSDAAVAALHRSGFAAVRQHQHQRSKFTTCACITDRKDPHAQSR